MLRSEPCDERSMPGEALGEVGSVCAKSGPAFGSPMLRIPIPARASSLPSDSESAAAKPVAPRKRRSLCFRRGASRYGGTSRR